MTILFLGSTTMNTKKLLALAVLGFLPFAAHAGSFSAAATGAPGASVTLTVAFTGDGSSTEAQTDFQFSNTNVTISAPVIAATGAICQIISPTRIRTISPSGPNAGNDPIPTGPTSICTFTAAIGGAAPEGLIPFTAQAGTSLCFDVGANPVMPCTVAANSGVTVANQPIPRTLSYNPAVGSTITFAAGATPGTSAPSQNIAVTAAGTSGSATLTGCAITGTGAASFSVAPTSLTFNTSISQNLVVGCTYPVANAAATLTCTETDGDTVAPGAARAFQLACPAPTVNPTITANPASGSTITVSGGLAATQGLSLIDLSATGGSGAGTTAISCTSTGNVQISASPATPSGQGPVVQNVTTGQPTDIRVGVQLTANAQSPAGTITCTVAGQANLTYTVNSPAGVTTVPPTFIPSSSTWSALALLSLLGVFGLLAVAFRRQA